MPAKAHDPAFHNMEQMMSRNKYEHNRYVDPLDTKLSEYVSATVEKLKEKGYCPNRCVEVLTKSRAKTEAFPLTFDAAEKIIFLRLKQQINEQIKEDDFPF